MVAKTLEGARRESFEYSPSQSFEAFAKGSINSEFEVNACVALISPPKKIQSEHDLSVRYVLSLFCPEEPF
jgi:hypothetical protein